MDFTTRTLLDRNQTLQTTRNTTRKIRKEVLWQKPTITTRFFFWEQHTEYSPHNQNVCRDRPSTFQESWEDTMTRTRTCRANRLKNSRIMLSKCFQKGLQTTLTNMGSRFIDAWNRDPLMNWTLQTKEHNNIKTPRKECSVQANKRPSADENQNRKQGWDKENTIQRNNKFKKESKKFKQLKQTSKKHKLKIESNKETQDQTQAKNQKAETVEWHNTKPTSRTSQQQKKVCQEWNWMSNTVHLRARTRYWHSALQKLIQDANRVHFRDTYNNKQDFWIDKNKASFKKMKELSINFSE